MNGEFNRFPEIAAKLGPAVSRAVRKCAFDIQAVAAAAAPVDTGFLRNSIYVSGTGFNTYGQGVQSAGTLKANKQGVITRRRLQSHVKRLDRQRQQEAMLLPEVAPPPDPYTAHVAVGASYGVYLEFGTRHMPAQPYFYPAVEAGLASLEAAMSKFEEAL